MSEWSPAERLVSGPAPIGATRPSVDVQSVLCDDAQGDHVKELVKLDDRLTRREVPVEDVRDELGVWRKLFHRLPL